MSYTKGPWRVEPRGNLKARQFVEAGTFRIAECLTRDQEANARLIASAPNLVAALKLAESTLRRLQAIDGAQGTLDVIRIALAEAGV